MNDPNNTLWPIRKVENVRQLTYDIPDTESKLRSNCFIGVSPIRTNLLTNTDGSPTGEATVLTTAHLVCQDEPDLALTRIKWDFGSRGGMVPWSTSSSEDRALGVPKTFRTDRRVHAGRVLRAVRHRRAWESRHSDSRPGVLGAQGLGYRGSGLVPSVGDYDTIICPRKP